MRKVRVLLVPAIVVGCMVAAGCDGDASAPQGAKPSATKTVAPKNPKKEWVRIASDGAGWTLEEKCFDDDLVFRSSVYGGYSVTIHPNANQCVSNN